MACRICGAPLKGDNPRQVVCGGPGGSACQLEAARRRAEASRKRRARAEADRDARVRGLLAEALKVLAGQKAADAQNSGTPGALG